MKRAILKITPQAMSAVLGFCEGIMVSEILRTPSDLRCDTFSIVVTGEGLGDRYEHAEGSEPKIIDPLELRGHK